VSDVPYDELDPNIRKVVKWLNDNGFKTVESHDGDHKFEGKTDGEKVDLECEGVPHFPMVVIEVEDADLLVQETERLAGHVEDIVGEIFPWVEDAVDTGDLAISAFYDPTVKRAFIRITQLADDWFDPYDKMKDPSDG
jgi:hypothetical protein